MESINNSKKIIVVIVAVLVVLAISVVAYAGTQGNPGTIDEKGTVVTNNTEDTPVNRTEIVKKMENGEIEGSAAYYTVDENGLTGIAIVADIHGS